MRTQWVWCIWILAALLLVASVDATPDPPALDPHFSAIKVPCPSEGVKSNWLPSESGSSLNLLARVYTQGDVFAAETEPNGPTRMMAETRHAADPSPPLPTRSL